MRKKTEDAILSKNGKLNKNNALDSVKKTRLRSLFWEFLKIGLFTIGGGVAMLPQLQQTITEKGWMDENETLDAIALSQSLPGVVAINIGTYVGYKKRGIIGALLATIGVIIPAFFSIIVLVMLLDTAGDNRIIDGAFMGVKSAVCGLIIVTAVKLLKQVVKRDNAVFAVIMCVGSFVAVGVLGIAAILVIIVGIIAGILFYNLFLIKKREAKSEVEFKDRDRMVEDSTRMLEGDRREADGK